MPGHIKTYALNYLNHRVDHKGTMGTHSFRSLPAGELFAKGHESDRLGEIQQAAAARDKHVA